MHEITTPLVESFARAHPIAQFLVLLVMLAVVVISLIISVRTRWHHQRTREERDRFMSENLDLKRQLDQCRERHEKLVRKCKIREAAVRAELEETIGKLHG